MPDLLSLLHEERPLLEAIYHLSETEPGFPQRRGLTYVAQDMERLLRLQSAGVLQLSQDHLHLTPQARGLLHALFSQSPPSSTAKSPTDTPLLRHLRWLEELIEADALRQQSNVIDLLVHNHALPIDGKESWSLRPRLSDLIRLNLAKGSRQLRSEAESSTLVPDSALEGTSPLDLPAWPDLREAFSQCGTDLLSFLQKTSQNPGQVAEWYSQALLHDAANLRITTTHVPWAKRQWALIYWQT